MKTEKIKTYSTKDFEQQVYGGLQEEGIEFLNKLPLGMFVDGTEVNQSMKNAVKRYFESIKGSVDRLSTVEMVSEREKKFNAEFAKWKEILLAKKVETYPAYKEGALKKIYARLDRFVIENSPLEESVDKQLYRELKNVAHNPNLSFSDFCFQNANRPRELARAIYDLIWDEEERVSNLVDSIDWASLHTSKDLFAVIKNCVENVDMFIDGFNGVKRNAEMLNGAKTAAVRNMDFQLTDFDKKFHHQQQPFGEGLRKSEVKSRNFDKDLGI